MQGEIPVAHRIAFFMRKEQILKLQQQGYKPAEIARRAGVSRQYVHMCLTGYKNTGRKWGREKLYSLVWSPICQKCHFRPTNALHHKDGNNLNDAPDNLISLCKICHTEAHVLLRRINPEACIDCKEKNIFSGKKGKRCSPCFDKWYYCNVYRAKHHIKRRVVFPETCILVGCDKKSRCKGLCSTHYFQLLYKKKKESKLTY